jgi:DnaK suppressor protein
MNTIDSTQVTHLRSKLQHRAAVLSDEIRQTLLKSDQESHLAIAEQARDWEDDATADLLVDTNLAEIDRDVTELRQAEAALARIAAATYGRCDDCGELIDNARLEANPAANRCVACQNSHERMRISTPTL